MKQNFTISSPKFDTTYAESAVLELKYKNNNKPLLIGSIYIQELKDVVQNYIYSHEIILSGDWNANIPKKNEKPNQNHQIISD